MLCLSLLNSMTYSRPRTLSLAKQMPLALCTTMALRLRPRIVIELSRKRRGARARVIKNISIFMKTFTKETI